MRPTRYFSIIQLSNSRVEKLLLEKGIEYEQILLRMV